MKKITFLFSVLISHIAAQTSEQTYFLGHSLVNIQMPSIVHSLALDAGYSADDYDYQIGIGANLNYQWNPPYSEQGIIYNIALPSGIYDNFVFTEAVPLKGHLLYSNTDEFADSLYQLAVAGNSSIKTYLYETWHCNNSGMPEGCNWDPESNIPWRTRITQDLDDWESIIDSLITKNPTGEYYIVPGGQGMGRLYDAIEANTIPGIDSVEQFFLDDIHLTHQGNYFIACIMFATLYGETPEGLTNATFDEDNLPFPVIDLALATRLQEIAWETVCLYPMSGVNCAVGIENNSEILQIKYSNHTLILPNMDGSISITDLSGKQVFFAAANQQSVLRLDLPSNGLYIAEFVSSMGKSHLKFNFIK